jgi:hypothetical protein
MKVVNEDEVSVTTKVVIKQLRYIPITARLKQLFLSKETAKRTRWHMEGKHDSEDSDIMLHLVDGEAWQILDHFDTEFAGDPRSVHLGLSMDHFKVYNTDSSPYSCWPIFIMPYNLSLNICLKQEFTFLFLVISSPKHPKKKINMFLRPLIEELKEL